MEANGSIAEVKDVGSSLSSETGKTEVIQEKVILRVTDIRDLRDGTCSKVSSCSSCYLN